MTTFRALIAQQLTRHPPIGDLSFTLWPSHYEVSHHRLCCQDPAQPFSQGNDSSVSSFRMQKCKSCPVTNAPTWSHTGARWQGHHYEGGKKSICGGHFPSWRAGTFLKKSHFCCAQKKRHLACDCFCVYRACVCVCACMSACMVNRLLCNPFEILLTETCSESGGVCVERISRGFLLPGDGLQL